MAAFSTTSSPVNSSGSPVNSGSPAAGSLSDSGYAILSPNAAKAFTYAEPSYAFIARKSHAKTSSGSLSYCCISVEDSSLIDWQQRFKS